MTAVHEFECDGCGKRVTLEHAHGWLTTNTMYAPEDPTPVEKYSATTCSLGCLVEWADRKEFEEREPDVVLVRVPPPFAGSGPTPYL